MLTVRGRLFANAVTTYLVDPADGAVAAHDGDRVGGAAGTLPPYA